jgi:hypothetical protein
VFYTGDTDSFLDEVSLKLSTGTAPPSGTFDVQLYIGRGMSPYQFLTTLNGPVNNPGSGVSLYTYTPSTSITLLADTPYFVLAYDPNSDEITSYEWQLTGNDPTVGIGNGSSDFEMRVQVEPVPEPSEATLLILAGGLLFAANRWRGRHVPHSS